jgi:hypothetical protein
VSYALAFSSVAREAFNRLEVALQEDVLDELDRLAAAADALPHRPLPLSALHDLRRDTADHADYVFLTLEYDPPQRTLTVRRLGHHTRPLPGD